MPARILLVRHGRSALPRPGGWLAPDDVRAWRASYDATGIRPDERPPVALCARAASAGAILASDLPRATASAERLAAGRPVLATPLLRESPLPIPHWPRARLPFAVWEGAIHAWWGWRAVLGVGGSSGERERARAAATLLVDHARSGDVVVVTHGVFRTLLRAALLSAGWEREGSHRSFACWSAWTFRLPGPVAIRRDLVSDGEPPRR